jgi:hypothetical protein
MLGIAFYSVALAPNDPPVLISNCNFHMPGGGGILLDTDRDVVKPSANVIIRNNHFDGCGQPICILAAAQRVLVVGNIVTRGAWSGIDLRDLEDRAGNILIANNTVFWSERAHRVYDDKNKGNAGLKAANVRIQNNLILKPKLAGDLFFFDHPRGAAAAKNNGAGDTAALLKAWRYSHNWRELDAPPVTDKAWIPGPADVIKAPIEVMSREFGAKDFLRPAGKSPLATGGVNDAYLPAYVGAVRPEGVSEWNWNWTWDALVHKRTSVSKNPADGGRFRTIDEARGKIEPGMTIRVLDDADHEEQLEIKLPDRYSGVTVEAAPREKK